MPLAQQVKGLRGDLYDAGFAQSADVGEGVIAEPIWTDPVVVVLQARHPLLTHVRVPLKEVLHYPLVLGNREVCEGCTRQIERALQAIAIEPQIAERVGTIDLLLTLVAAGYGVGLASAAHMEICRHPDVVTRP